MGLFVHRSNRLERLAERLAALARTPLSDPFARECIVVQGPGMERWLSAALSRELGVWANPWFPFPRTLIELFLERVGEPDPELEQKPRFDANGLVWSIARLLPALCEQPAFHSVSAYLEGDRDAERRLELSRQLADSFDQYVIYRPDLVLGWQAGKDHHFQALLLRELLAQAPRPHLAQRMQQFARALAQGRFSVADRALPERISLFGISTLPPAFLELLAQLGQTRDVHLFLLTPSREYWGDLDRTVAIRHDLHGFLASLGKVGREFIDALEKHPYEEAEELFELPRRDSMLRALQCDLVELTARARRGADVERPWAVHEQDDSIQVHVCHSVVRELEVLRDQLRMRLERDPTLEARDVIVFAPDIERYAPAIEAVFSERGPHDDKSIPYRIADRRTLHTSEIAQALFALLELTGSRLPLSDVLDVLHRECVRARFEIAEVELDRAQQWLVDAGARWALDGAHRASFGQPGFAENSLRFALDRLLVGYAASDGEGRELYDVLPLSDAEGQSALLLGKLARFLETLFHWVRVLSAPRAPAEFAAQLGELMSALLSDEGELAIEHHALRSALAELGADAERAQFTESVSLRSFAQLLEERIDRGRANLGFLAGGVTFCEPVPMRAIPFRVVCLLGMDDESFPRSRSRPGFDLMAEAPRPCDRSLRDDDRQLFLEAILSARDALHISYVGRSAQDGALRPASVLVDQLLRLCDAHFVFAAADRTLSLGFEGAVSESMRHEHALHRFDARYFQRSAPRAYWSYDESAALAARSAAVDKHEVPLFVAEPLPAPESEPSELSLEAFTRFFRYPQESFFKQRLKVYLPRELAELPDREPLELDALERYKLGDELLRKHQTHAVEERGRLLRKAGKLAPGSLGVAQLARLEETVQEVIAASPPSTPLPDRELSIELDGLRLTGRLTNLEQVARVERTVGKLNPRRRLSGWITHLALCASADEGVQPRSTRLVGREPKENGSFRPLDKQQALDRLRELVALYRIGMRMPLPLLHSEAETLVKALRKGEPLNSALEQARGKLNPMSPAGGTLQDEHVLQAWSREQLQELESLFASDGQERVSFVEVSERTFGPLFEHYEKLSAEEP